MFGNRCLVAVVATFCAVALYFYFREDETESDIVDENRLMWKIANKEQKKGGAELSKTGTPSSLPGRKGYQGEHVAAVKPRGPPVIVSGRNDTLQKKTSEILHDPRAVFKSNMNKTIVKKMVKEVYDARLNHIETAIKNLDMNESTIMQKMAALQRLNHEAGSNVADVGKLKEQLNRVSKIVEVLLARLSAVNATRVAKREKVRVESIKPRPMVVSPPSGSERSPPPPPLPPPPPPPPPPP
mmetsp:Transcript_25763/g.84947  ORF Transcript_25763/g.84947 Transcript_25763/m.84947 type:complete len:241 (-) Transcript_25763:171-893(-)